MPSKIVVSPLTGELELGAGAAGTGSGTVTSVGLALPAMFTVSGSPVIIAGVLTGTLVNQTANTVFSGPAVGAPATPTFRLLVADDIPSLDAAKITTGNFGTARGGTGLAAIGSANQVLGVNSGATALEYKSIIAGANVSVVHGAGSVTINNTSSATVSSVGLSMPSIFSVAGSPITTTGTFSVTFTTQTANTIFSGPTSGAPATPTFRTLVADDIPSLDAAKITTGAFGTARGGTGLAAIGSANQFLGVNSGATALEYKSILGTTNQISVVHGAGSVTLNTPQDIDTAANVTFGSVTAATMRGSASSGANLTLQSTSHATKGKILFGASAYDEVNDRIGIGTATPICKLQLLDTSALNNILHCTLTTSGIAISAIKLNVTASATSGSVYGLDFGVTAAPSLASSVAYRGVQGFARTASGNTQNFTGSVYGGQLTGQHFGSGTLSAIAAIWLYTYIELGSGAITNCYSVYVQHFGNSTATITTQAGIYVEDITNAGTITNTYGVYVGDVTAGTQTNTAFSFYAVDANALNYFAGKTGIGTTAPTALLHLAASTTARASLRIAAGTAPTTPNSGDMWFTGASLTGLKFFDGTATRTITMT